jgi:hypothetical protein
MTKAELIGVMADEAEISQAAAAKGAGCVYHGRHERAEKSR